MKEWREYSAEDDVSWEILMEVSQIENITDRVSINGNEATICSKRRAGDYVSISIISASREFDSITGRLGFEKDFHIKIECLRDGWSCISSEKYKADEALQLTKLFLGQRKDTAKKIWNMKKLGSEGNRIEGG